MCRAPCDRAPGEESEWPEEVAAELGIHPNRAHRIFEKWWGKRWVECGVRIGLAWMEPKGLAAARAIEEGRDPHEAGRAAPDYRQTWRPHTP